MPGRASSARISSAMHAAEHEEQERGDQVHPADQLVVGRAQHLREQRALDDLVRREQPHRDGLRHQGPASDRRSVIGSPVVVKLFSAPQLLRLRRIPSRIVSGLPWLAPGGRVASGVATAASYRLRQPRGSSLRSWPLNSSSPTGAAGSARCTPGSATNPIRRTPSPSGGPGATSCSDPSADPAAGR